MTTFEGPPANGETLSLQRSPVLLRVTFTQNTGEIDALDLLDDVPKDTEQMVVYVLVGNPRWVHIDGQDRKTGKRWSRNEVSSRYKVFDHQPPDAVMRDNESWHRWCLSMAPFLSRPTFDPLTDKRA